MQNFKLKMVALALICAFAFGSAAFAADAKNVKSVGSAEKNWMVRGRLIAVVPQEDASLNIGGNVNIDNSVVPELDISYFFDKNWAAELILATAPHDAKATAGPIDLGTVWLLPPTLTLQYHFDNFDGFKPYVGAGVNYTWFYNIDKGPAINSIHYDSSFGPALQIGVDIPVGNDWYVNADLKKIWINTDVKANGAVTADVDIDPWVFGLGMGYRF